MAGALRVTDREAICIDLGLGEKGPELDLAGVSTPVGALAFSAFGVRGHGWHTGAVQCDVELGDWRVGWERHQFTGRHRSCLGVAGRQQSGPVGFCTALHPFAAQRQPPKLGEQVVGFGERYSSRSPVGHRAQPRLGQRRPGGAGGLVAQVGTVPGPFAAFETPWAASAGPRRGQWTTPNWWCRTGGIVSPDRVAPDPGSA